MNLSKAFGIFLLVSLVAASASARGLSGRILESSFLTRTALSGLSAQRCMDNLRPLGLQRNKGSLKGCLSLLSDFQEFLDLEAVPQEDGRPFTVVFRADLMRMIADPRFAPLTGQLRQELETAHAYAYSFSLFRSVRAFTRDRAEALHWIGVLFQDVTPLQVHLQWARAKTKDPGTLAKIEAFSAFLEELWRLSLIRNEVAGSLELYPPEIEADLKGFDNAKIYHFYVPAVLTKKALDDGYSKEVAAYLGYHFNFLYEAFGESKALSLAWKDPARLTGKESARDAYLGLRGSLYVMNPSHASFLPPDYMERLGTDSRDMHRELIGILGWYFRWSKNF